MSGKRSADAATPARLPRSSDRNINNYLVAQLLPLVKNPAFLHSRPTG